MAFTTDDLARIEAAIAKGEKSVAFADRVTVYRDIDDLLKARDTIRAALSSRAKQTLVVGSKGLGPPRCA